MNIKANMERLFEIDIKDYKDTDKVFRRPSARAIIIQDDKIALVYSRKEKYYKFPGGGIHDDEDKKEALIREVREEVGMIVIPESIREFGSVLRRQKSGLSENTIFEQENYYYFCDVKDHITSQELDDYEKEAGFVLRIVDIDTAITANDIYTSDISFDEIMIKRELRVLKMIKQELKKNQFKIKTERMILVPLGIKYLETVNEYALDYENTKYMCHLPNESSEETAEFLKNIDKEWEKDKPEFYELAMIYQGKHIGAVCVYFDGEEGELGWILNKKYWGNGFAVEAAKALIDYSKEHLAIYHYIAHCDGENVASFKTMEKLGMVKTEEKSGRKNRAADKESIDYKYELNL